MLEPLGVAIHSVDLAHLKTGMTVGVFGCGPIGLMIIQLARLSGAASIVATDKLSHRAEAAKAFGAQHVFWVDERLAGGEIRAAVVNLGRRPTFGEGRLALEAHILDFTGDLYVARVRLGFHRSGTPLTVPRSPPAPG